MLFEPAVPGRRALGAEDIFLQSPKVADQHELLDEGIDVETKPRLAGEGESLLRFALNICERLPRNQKAGEQILRAVDGIGQVAYRIRRIERAP
jgi:hypothetical protein